MILRTIRLPFLPNMFPIETVMCEKCIEMLMFTDDNGRRTIKSYENTSYDMSSQVS